MNNAANQITTPFHFDLIDVENLIERFEEMRDSEDAPEDAAYFCMVEDLLRELAGNGGDVQWEGEWYPAVLIHEDYFTDYTRELMMDCEMLPRDLPEWVEIDWESTACNVRVMDYTSIEVDGVTYWYR